ncbi:hypothetical protein XENOCAPTIV_014625 [Xenoophorus captivus]|uniref:PH domain-containing protein n=1 Tax=Xenoophorus captivus TaxID=1517983 RepID=A0ABV0S7T0_9TELE
MNVTAEHAHLIALNHRRCIYNNHTSPIPPTLNDHRRSDPTLVRSDLTNCPLPFQAKPVYAGWLCLAPVGTDFDNPMQRSRKWQRRFFILYERGSLTYALDELPSTLPQGTVNMNLCTNVTDAEPTTGQRNALCIVTPAQEIFIRGENKEIINGWCEQLTVYLRTNKQSQKKKRKVDPVTNQDPSPAKMAATGQSCPASEAGSADFHHWQEELHAAGLDVTPEGELHKHGQKDSERCSDLQASFRPNSNCDP